MTLDFEVLNVACGAVPSGDVNCDLFAKESEHRARYSDGMKLEVKRIRNFVLCDALHLPFRSGAFRSVVCSHVIEHLENPFGLLKELLRVSEHEVLVRCPHRLGDRLEGNFSCHVGFFNRSWFVIASQNLGVYCNTRVSQRKPVPFSFLPVFSVPVELEVELWKK